MSLSPVPDCASAIILLPFSCNSRHPPAPLNLVKYCTIMSDVSIILANLTKPFELGLLPNGSVPNIVSANETAGNSIELEIMEVGMGYCQAINQDNTKLVDTRTETSHNRRGNSTSVKTLPARLA